MEVRPRGCDYSVHVHVDERHFIVEYDECGNVLRIKERKKKENPTIGVYDVSWWVPSSHVLGKSPYTRPRRVIAAAAAKMAAEDAAHNATP